MNELEKLAQNLGNRAAERLDVEVTARAVIERLREPEQDQRRVTWIGPEWLRVAAALALLLGAGLVLQKVATDPAPSHYVLEDLRDLTASELTELLSTLDRTLADDSLESPLELERLTPAELEAVLRSLDT